eukprot:COSAG02_NODE_1896_length_10463_cov_8.034253_7_plen_160_part_00
MTVQVAEKLPPTFPWSHLSTKMNEPISLTLGAPLIAKMAPTCSDRSRYRSCGASPGRPSRGALPDLGRVSCLPPNAAGSHLQRRRRPLLRFPLTERLWRVDYTCPVRRFPTPLLGLPSDVMRSLQMVAPTTASPVVLHGRYAPPSPRGCDAPRYLRRRM